MPQLPMLLPPLLWQIYCCFCEPRAQPNLQLSEMQPNPWEHGVCKGKAIFEETITTYYLFSSKIHVHPEKINKIAIHPENTIKLLFTPNLHAEQTACRTKYPHTH
jgi:hypothetical protein